MLAFPIVEGGGRRRFRIMALVPKDLLYPGEWHLRDGRVFRCTPGDVRHFATRLNEMREKGLHVPVTWEHQPDIKPATRAAWLSRNADMARMTAGFATSARDEGGVLCGDLEIPDEADRKQLPKTRFVSPMIEWDYRDPTGKVWSGPSITHIAITPAPVQYTQQPFGSPSLTSGAGAPVAMSTLQFQSPITLSLAMYRPVALGDTAMADEDYTPADDMGGENNLFGGDAAASATDPLLTEVIALLKAKNIVIPDDTTMEDLLPHLRTALMTHAAATGEGDETKEPDGDEVNGMEPRPETQVMMSQLSSLQSQVGEANRIITSLRAAVSATQTEALQQRIDRLSRHGVDRRTIGDLKRSLSTVSLSVTDDGSLERSDLLTRIEAYESLPVATIRTVDTSKAKPVSLSRTGRVEADDSDNDDDKTILRKLKEMA